VHTQKRELTPKQQKFVQEYLSDLNATQAAIRAGYSPKTAEVQGPRLLGNVRVSSAIHAWQQRAAKKADITLDSHLAKLAELRDMAIQAGQLGPAITAEAQRGKAAGLYVERHDVTSNGEGLTRFVPDLGPGLLS